MVSGFALPPVTAFHCNQHIPIDSSDNGVVRLVVLLPPPHKHHDDHAKNEGTQGIEHGDIVSATGDVDYHSDERGDSVDAPRFDRFRRPTGLPAPYAFNR